MACRPATVLADTAADLIEAANATLADRGIEAALDPVKDALTAFKGGRAMLQAGYDVKTVAERGGWKDAATVLRTYAHAIKDRSVTNVLFDTRETQEVSKKPVTTRKIRRKQA